MITRFYVDNYKSLVNFEYNPKSFELILGANGSGKSTVFEALMCIQEFILHEKDIEEVIPYSSLTRWQSRKDVALELEIMDGEYKYTYELTVQVSEFSSYVKKEVLRLDGRKVVESNLKTEVENDEWEGQVINTYMEVSSHVGGKEKIYRSASWNESILSNYGRRFKDLLGQIIFIKIESNSMMKVVSGAERLPNRSFSNFPAYYLYLLQERQNLVFDLLPVLRDNIQGFLSFSLPDRGKDSRLLRVEFSLEGGKRGDTTSYSFDELSDGQRALIALYSVAFCEANSSLFIDEPENYISLRELQPWLMLLRERIEDFGGQAILISHHPEFINVMAPQDAIQFHRKNGGPVQIRPFETEQFEGLTPAEIVARGWENE